MPPLKRHPALAPLSRKHHNGLMLVLKTRKGIKHRIDMDRISRYIQYCFDKDLRLHFDKEENGIFTWLPENHPLRLRAFSEHASIREVVSRLNNNPHPLPLILRFSGELQDHIRFEERILFPYLQSQFPEKLTSCQDAEPQQPSCDVDHDWPDHFWVVSNKK